MAEQKPRYGYRRLWVMLRREGEVVNHKRVYRVYREAGLSLKRKKRRRLIRVAVEVASQISAVNQQWAVDFVHDVLAGGRKFRVLSVVDEYSRECLALEVDTSFPSQRVTRALETIIADRGKPQSIRMDNGPELTSRHIWPGVSNDRLN